MLAFCPTCWNEITKSPTVCRKCGSIVNLASPEYETQLLYLLSACNSTRRVEVCLLLGQQKRRAAVRRLALIVGEDPEAVVRVAALRALGEIGDDSAIDEITNFASSEETPISSMAREILTAFKDRSIGNR